jgi:hypothetical protein
MGPKTKERKKKSGSRFHGESFIWGHKHLVKCQPFLISAKFRLPASNCAGVFAFKMFPGLFGGGLGLG